jgi:hypothetical protein
LDEQLYPIEDFKELYHFGVLLHPQENPIEDIWLQLKTWLRKHYYQYETFEQLLEDCYELFKSRIFNFTKCSLISSLINLHIM